MGSAETSHKHTVESWTTNWVRQHWQTLQCSSQISGHLISASTSRLFVPGNLRMLYVYCWKVSKFSIFCTVSQGCVSIWHKEASCIWTVKLLSEWWQSCRFRSASWITNSSLSYEGYHITALLICLLPKAMTVVSPSSGFCDNAALTVY